MDLLKRIALIFNQGISQNLEIGCPNLMEILKQSVQIVHFLHVNDR